MQRFFINICVADPHNKIGVTSEIYMDYWAMNCLTGIWFAFHLYVFHKLLPRCHCRQHIASEERMQRGIWLNRALWHATAAYVELSMSGKSVLMEQLASTFYAFLHFLVTSSVSQTRNREQYIHFYFSPQSGFKSRTLNLVSHRASYLLPLTQPINANAHTRKRDAIEITSIDQRMVLWLRYKPFQPGI